MKNEQNEQKKKKKKKLPKKTPDVKYSKDLKVGPTLFGPRLGKTQEGEGPPTP